MIRKLTMTAAALALLLSAGCWRDPSTIEKPTRYREAEDLFLKGKYRQAKDLFQELSETDAYAEKPFRQEALYHTALCDQQLAAASPSGRAYLESAIRTLNEILSAPTYASMEARALETRGDISLEVGDYAGASRDYRRALVKAERLGPVSSVDRGKLLFGAGMAEWNQRNYADSDRYFDQYLEGYPQGPFVGEARKHHRRLGGGLAPSASFYVAVGGSFTIRRQAETLVDKLKARKFGAAVEPSSAAGTATYVVRVGAFEDRKVAELQARELEKAGFWPVKVMP